MANQCNLYAPPAGPGKDVPSIVADDQEVPRRQQDSQGRGDPGYGYDENVMPNGRLLNRDDLDQAFPDNPVLVGHVSMHGAVLNSAAMKKWNLSAETKTPPGGVIVRKPGTQRAVRADHGNGVPADLRVAAEADCRRRRSSGPSPARSCTRQHGVTTAHEGATHAAELA